MEKKEHEFCLRCGRRLKNPQAREKGYGAVCEKKLKVVTMTKLFEKSGREIELKGIKYISGEINY